MSTTRLAWLPRFGGVRSHSAAARGAASIGLLLGLFAAVGCGESPVAPGAPERNVVVEDGRNRGDDPYVVNSAAIDGHELTLEVSYGGGCERHDFTLVISSTFLESDPVQLRAALAHEANGDACEAWITESIDFDLALVRTRYQEFYGPGAGTVVLLITGVSGHDLVYEFAG
ncbi:hypothetical protein [Candidatus Palauibacter sp.]|uniref:hypothetical protein n=1 Tax=Candidatus Palauibacter sp. TaxID=3101350 RepID=UPI003B5287E2